MADSFDPVEYLGYLRRRWGVAAAAVSLAVAAAVGFGLVLEKQYTATATLVIEPPSMNDMRSATAVSSVYLESLKAYEQFAAGDSLFARACEKFGLLTTGTPVEALKRRVLRVTKVKDTKLLRVAVTLPDPQQAHAVARYLAEETVALNRAMAREGDRELVGDMQAQLQQLRDGLDQARAEYNAVAAGGADRVWNEELHTLADLKARTGVELLRTKANVAEMTARGQQPELAAEKAREQSLTAAAAALDRDMAAKSAALTELRARQDRTGEALRTAEEAYEGWSRRSVDMAALTGLRTEQLRIVDPGIVPQQPSAPNVPLMGVAALLLSLLFSIGFLSVRYGWERQRARPAVEPMEIRVARSGNR